MTISNCDSFIEVYRLKAKSKNIHELSGRGEANFLTSFISNSIIQVLNLNEKSNFSLVDVGCGDGNLISELIEKNKNQIHCYGVLPTIEEVEKVSPIFQNNKNVVIKQGVAEKLPIESDSMDYLICNGVVILLSGTNHVQQALLEFFRIMKPGSKLFIGEVPDKDEFVDKNYGSSLIRWLLFVLKRQGFKFFLKNLRKLIICAVTDEPFIVAPKKHFFIPHKKFCFLLESAGFKEIKFYKHLQIDQEGNIYESQTRWNFIAEK